MHWSSKIVQDRSENVKMYVEFTQDQAVWPGVPEPSFSFFISL